VKSLRRPCTTLKLRLDAREPLFYRRALHIVLVIGAVTLGGKSSDELLLTESFDLADRRLSLMFEPAGPDGLDGGVQRQEPLLVSCQRRHGAA
jgi:hypothetical protein